MPCMLKDVGPLCVHKKQLCGSVQRIDIRHLGYDAFLNHESYNYMHYKTAVFCIVYSGVTLSNLAPWDQTSFRLLKYLDL